MKIPLKKFVDKGKAWDANKQAEVAKDVQWNKIQEIRFSVGKGENQGEPGKPAPVTIFVDQITFTETIDWVDPDIKWDNWKSKAPDMIISDFEGKFAKDKWEPSFGPKSKAEIEMPYKSSKLDGNSLFIKHFEMSDWVDFVLDFTKNPAHDAKLRDWTNHWGVMFDVYSERAWQSITVQIGDAGNELFVSNTGVPRGRTTVIVPFRTFSKFPYYQPPNAKENGVFDLKNVVSIDFKPGGEGSNGSFEIDNIKLTNQREVKAAARPAVVKVDVKGTGDVINPNISGGLFGINAALWDGDMLDNPKFKVQTRRRIPRMAQEDRLQRHVHCQLRFRHRTGSRCLGEAHQHRQEGRHQVLGNR